MLDTCCPSRDCYAECRSPSPRPCLLSALAPSDLPSLLGLSQEKSLLPVVSGALHAQTEVNSERAESRAKPDRTQEDENMARDVRGGKGEWGGLVEQLRLFVVGISETAGQQHRKLGTMTSAFKFAEA